jgi:hypothetical protein
MKKCPYCAEEIQDEAIVCRYCGRQLEYKLTPSEELAKRREDVLNYAIARAQSQGWVLISNSGGVAQLKKPKDNFSWGCFILGLILAIIVGIIYVIYYAVQKEEIMTLTTNEQGELVVRGVSTSVVAGLFGQQSITAPQTPEEAKAAEKSTIKALLILILIIGGVVLLIIAIAVILSNLPHQ